MSKLKNWWNRVSPWKKKPVVVRIAPVRPAPVNASATQATPVVEKAKKVEETIEVGVGYEPIVIENDQVVGSNYNKIKPQPENLNHQLGGRLDQD